MRGFLLLGSNRPDHPTAIVPVSAMLREVLFVPLDWSAILQAFSLMACRDPAVGRLALAIATPAPDVSRMNGM